MSDPFSIRPMSLDDLRLALDWARAEGWNPGIDDAPAFYAADPSGYFMGWLGERPVGCISVVKYGADFAFLGLYIVHPDFRDMGFGKALWDAGMASAAGRTIGLDGVTAQQDNYRRSGFQTASITRRYGGIARSDAMASVEVRAITAADLPAVQAYDAGIFRQPRAAFLTAWCQADENRQALVVMQGETVRGYGVRRRCHDGAKIGPLFADTPAVAQNLLSALVAGQEGHVILDVPLDNGPAVSMATALGLSPVFETARMYHGPAPAVPLQRVFGISTLELG